jgi:hypothetical protein
MSTWKNKWKNLNIFTFSVPSHFYFFDKIWVEWRQNTGSLKFWKNIKNQPIYGQQTIAIIEETLKTRQKSDYFQKKKEFEIYKPIQN